MSRKLLLSLLFLSLSPLPAQAQLNRQARPTAPAPSVQEAPAPAADEGATFSSDETPSEASSPEQDSASPAPAETPAASQEQADAVETSGAETPSAAADEPPAATFSSGSGPAADANAQPAPQPSTPPAPAQQDEAPAATFGSDTAPQTAPAPSSGEQAEQVTTFGSADATEPEAPAPSTADTFRLETGQLVINKRAGSENGLTLSGFTGVFRTVSGRTGIRNGMRFGSHLGFYYLGDEWDNADHTRLDIRGHLIYNVLDNLEVHLDGFGTAHRITPNATGLEPEFIQTLGDLSLGGKYVHPINEYLSTGGLLDIKMYTRVRTLGTRLGTFSLLPMGMLTFDAREQPKLQWPLVAHLNLGFFWDNGYKALLAGDGANLDFDAELTASRINALNVRAGDQFILNFALEFPQDAYTVFLEYTTEQEINNKVGNGLYKEGWSSSAQRFTPGVRWNFIDRMVLDFAVDLSYGLTGEYIAARRAARSTNPYQLWFGLSYSHDPDSQKIVDTRGFVKGIVVDAETGEPLGGAIIQYPDFDVTRQVTQDEQGEFTSHPLLAGQARIRVVKEQYEPVVIAPTVLSQEVITEKILLRKIDEGGQLVGALVGNVLDSAAKPVGATLTFLDQDIAGTRSNPADGSFVKILPPGEYKVQVEAEGFDAKVFLVPIQARRKTRVVFELPSVGMSTVGALAGRLLAPDGKPVAGVISFPEADLRELIANPETGEFYASLPPGRYKIEVAAEGYGNRNYLIPIEAGKKTQVDIQLAPTNAVGAIAGRLLGPDGTPLAGGVVQFLDEKIGTLAVDPSTGNFYKVVPVGTYDVRLSAKGFAEKIVKVQILERKKTVQDFTLEPEGGAGSALVRLEGSRFLLARPVSIDRSARELSAEQRELLDALAAVLAQRKDLKVSVRAYTDDEGPAAGNLRLTQEQAELVVRYLVSKGIAAERLTAVGAGEEKPLVPNTTPDNRAKNRRVEFTTR